MGWYHVDRTGKGVMLNFLDCTEDLIEKLAITKDKLERWFPQDKFPNAENMTSKECLALYMLKNYMSCSKLGHKNISDITSEDLTELDIDEYTYEYENSMFDIVSYAFCDKYGYPYELFISAIDYNEDKMLFCDTIFPLPEKYKFMYDLTEEKYIKQLNEFFSELTGKQYNLELKICEMYIKE